MRISDWSSDVCSSDLTGVHCDRRNQLYTELNIVTRHNHLRAFGQDNFTSDVCCAEIELRTIVREEWRVTPAFLLRQHIDFGIEISVRRTGAGLRSEERRVGKGRVSKCSIGRSPSD